MQTWLSPKLILIRSFCFHSTPCRDLSRFPCRIKPSLLPRQHHPQVFAPSFLSPVLSTCSLFFFFFLLSPPPPTKAHCSGLMQKRDQIWSWHKASHPTGGSWGWARVWSWQRLYNLMSRGWGEKNVVQFKPEHAAHIFCIPQLVVFAIHQWRHAVPAALLVELWRCFSLFHLLPHHPLYLLERAEGWGSKKSWALVWPVRLLWQLDRTYCSLLFWLHSGWQQRKLCSWCCKDALRLLGLSALWLVAGRASAWAHLG